MLPNVAEVRSLTQPLGTPLRVPNNLAKGTSVLAGLMRVYSDSVNMVNAPFLARERGIDVREVRHDREGDYHTLVRVSVDTEAGKRSVAGTLFGEEYGELLLAGGHLVGNRFIQLSGHDATSFGFNTMGGRGTISVVANAASMRRRARSRPR